MLRSAAPVWFPPELVNRFNDHWLVLEPYQAADFRALVAELGLPPTLIDPTAAVASGLNFRYVENAFTEHLLASEGPAIGESFLLQL